MERSIQETNLQAIADALREKEGSSGAIDALDFAERIRAIQAGGGGSDFAVPLIVTVDAGATVTATHGETTVTGTSGADGTAILILTAPGTWTVTAALGDKEQSQEVEVGEGYSAEFSLSSRLPGGYMEVEYIQSSGTQCIDTGIKPSSLIRVAMDVEPTEAGSSTAQTFFGSLYYSMYYYSYRMMWSSSGVGASYGRVPTTGLAVISADSTPRRMAIQMDGATAKASVDGVEKTLSNSGGLAAANPTIKLFASTANATNELSAKLYSAQIYSKEIIACDFVPCVNKDGEAGLFNLVTNEFYANVGTGAFIPGPAV